MEIKEITLEDISKKLDLLNEKIDRLLPKERDRIKIKDYEVLF